MSVELLINAIIAGLLLGGFYAAVTVGVSISFGILDIVNIAHPAFIILGSYIAYIVNQTFGLDPILTAIVVLPAFYVLGAAVYQVYYASFEKRGQDALRGLAFFFGLLFVTEVMLILVFGVDYRYVQAAYIEYTWHIGFIDLPFRMVIPCVMSLLMVGLLQLYLSRTFTGRAIMAVSQDQLALQLMAADPIKIKRIAFAISIATASLAGAFLIIIQPVEPSVGREYIGRVFAICVLGGLAKPARHGDRRDAAWRRRKPDRDILRPVMGAGGVVRLPAADAGVPAGRIVGTIGDRRARIPLLSRQHPGRRAVLRLRALARQRLPVLCRLHRAAIHRAGDRLEHPRRLLRLRELRLGGVFRARRLLVGGAAQARRRRRPLFSGVDRRLHAS